MTSKTASKATSKTYLEKHGNQWRVQVRVPPSLQSAMGKKRLLFPLHTSSLAEANRLKWEVVAKLKAEIRSAGAPLGKVPRETLTAEAMRWREAIRIEKPIEVPFVDEMGEHDAYYDTVMPDLALDRAMEIKVEQGVEAAEVFFKVATGKVTPIPALIDAWLAERRDIKPRQQRDYRRAVEKFHSWRQTPIEEVTKKVAGEYVGNSFITKGVHPKTADLTGLF